MRRIVQDRNRGMITKRVPAPWRQIKASASREPILGAELHSPTFFPVGMRKTRGMVNKRPRPKDRKVILKPLAGVELKWRIIVINEIPIAAPTDLNIPRSPVMVATLSGISSMQALLEAGKATPIPMPVNMVRIAKLPAAPKWIPILRMN